MAKKLKNFGFGVFWEGFLLFFSFFFFKLAFF